MSEYDNLAPVISLNEFRERMNNPPLDQPEKEKGKRSGYAPIDVETFDAIRSMLALLRGTEHVQRLMVVSRMVMKNTSEVLLAKENGHRYYVVDQSQEELESLTAHIERYDEKFEPMLEKALPRLHVATLIGRHALHQTDSLSYRPGDISMPKISKASVSAEDRPSWERITLWRAAAGLGLLAVGPERPTMRGHIRDYLNEVLEARLAYANNAVDFSDFFKVPVPADAVELDEFLLGTCNPLNPIEIQTVVKYPEPNH